MSRRTTTQRHSAGAMIHDLGCEAATFVRRARFLLWAEKSAEVLGALDAFESGSIVLLAAAIDRNRAEAEVEEAKARPLFATRPAEDGPSGVFLLYDLFKADSGIWLEAEGMEEARAALGTIDGGHAIREVKRSDVDRIKAGNPRHRPEVPAPAEPDPGPAPFNHRAAEAEDPAEVTAEAVEACEVAEPPAAAVAPPSPPAGMKPFGFGKPAKGFESYPGPFTMGGFPARWGRDAGWDYPLPMTAYLHQPKGQDPIPARVGEELYVIETIGYVGGATEAGGIELHLRGMVGFGTWITRPTSAKEHGDAHSGKIIWVGNQRYVVGDPADRLYLLFPPPAATAIDGPAGPEPAPAKAPIEPKRYRASELGITKPVDDRHALGEPAPGGFRRVVIPFRFVLPKDRSWQKEDSLYVLIEERYPVGGAHEQLLEEMIPREQWSGPTRGEPGWKAIEGGPREGEEVSFDGQDYVLCGPDGSFVLAFPPPPWPSPSPDEETEPSAETAPAKADAKPARKSPTRTFRATYHDPANDGPVDLGLMTSFSHSDAIARLPDAFADHTVDVAGAVVPIDPAKIQLTPERIKGKRKGDSAAEASPSPEPPGKVNRGKVRSPRWVDVSVGGWMGRLLETEPDNGDELAARVFWQLAVSGGVSVKSASKRMDLIAAECQVRAVIFPGGPTVQVLTKRSLPCRASDPFEVRPFAELLEESDYEPPGRITPEEVAEEFRKAGQDLGPAFERKAKAEAKLAASESPYDRSGYVAPGEHQRTALGIDLTDIPPVSIIGIEWEKNAKKGTIPPFAPCMIRGRTYAATGSGWKYGRQIHQSYVPAIAEDDWKGPDRAGEALNHVVGYFGFKVKHKKKVYFLAHKRDEITVIMWGREEAKKSYEADMAHTKRLHDEAERSREIREDLKIGPSENVEDVEGDEDGPDRYYQVMDDGPGRGKPLAWVKAPNPNRAADIARPHKLAKLLTIAEITPAEWVRMDRSIPELKEAAGRVQGDPSAWAGTFDPQPSLWLAFDGEDVLFKLEAESESDAMGAIEAANVRREQQGLARWPHVDRLETITADEWGFYRSISWLEAKPRPSLEAGFAPLFDKARIDRPFTDRM